MKYYVVNANYLWTENTNLEQAKKEIEMLIEREDYDEAQALQYIQLIKGEGLTFRVVQKALHIEII